MPLAGLIWFDVSQPDRIPAGQGRPTTVPASEPPMAGYLPIVPVGNLSWDNPLLVLPRRPPAPIQDEAGESPRSRYHDDVDRCQAWSERSQVGLRGRPVPVLASESVLRPNPVPEALDTLRPGESPPWLPGSPRRVLVDLTVGFIIPIEDALEKLWSSESVPQLRRGPGRGDDVHPVELPVEDALGKGWGADAIGGARARQRVDPGSNILSLIVLEESLGKAWQTTLADDLPRRPLTMVGATSSLQLPFDDAQGRGWQADPGSRPIGRVWTGFTVLLEARGVIAVEDVPALHRETAPTTLPWTRSGPVSGANQERPVGAAPEDASLKGFEVATVVPARPRRQWPGADERPLSLPVEDALGKGWNVSEADLRLTRPASVPSTSEVFVAVPLFEVILSAGETILRPVPRSSPQPAGVRPEAWTLPDDVQTLAPWRDSDPPPFAVPRFRGGWPSGDLAAGVLYVDQMSAATFPGAATRTAPARPAATGETVSGEAPLIESLAWRSDSTRTIVLAHPALVGDREQPPGWLDPVNVGAALQPLPETPARGPRPPRQEGTEPAIPGWLVLDLAGRAWLVPEQVPHPLPRPVLAGEAGRCLDPSPVLGLTWALPELPLPRPQPRPIGDQTSAPPIAAGLVVVAGPFYVVAADIWCAGATAGEVSTP